MMATLPNGAFGAIAELALRNFLRQEMEAGRLVVFTNVGERRETVALLSSESGKAGMVVGRWWEDAEQKR